MKKKGFTIVELVIVIAVIAILASVLVPTFSGIILKAKVSSDTQVVRMLNEYTKTDLASSGKEKHDTMYQAVQACLNQGISPDKIAAKSNYNIAWESPTGRFVLLDTATDIVKYPQGDETNNEYHIEIGHEKDYFVVTSYDNTIEEGTFKYSVYAFGNDWPSELTIRTGFDTGNVKSINKLIYKKVKDDSQNIIINTNNFNIELDIESNNDIINHFGYSYMTIVNNESLAILNEYGKIGRMKLNTGSINIKPYSEIFCLMNFDNVSNYNIDLYGKVHEQVDNINAAEGITKNIDGVCEGLIKVCEIHDIESMTEIINDVENVYCVCKTCGCTIKNVYETADLDLVKYEVNNAVSYGKLTKTNNDYCIHDFKYVETKGNCSIGGYEVFSCSNCGVLYNKPFQANEHNFVEEVVNGKNCFYCTRAENIVYDNFEKIVNYTVIDPSTEGYNDITYNTDECKVVFARCGTALAIFGDVVGADGKVEKRKVAGKYINVTTSFSYGDFLTNETSIEIINATVIGTNALKRRKATTPSPVVEKILIRNTVKKINNEAFLGFDKLKDIKMPNSVTYLSTNAFKDCTSLKTIELSRNINFIGPSLFENCTSLETVYMPKYHTIGFCSKMFLNCDNLKNVYIPEEATYQYNMEEGYFFEGTVDNASFICDAKNTLKTIPTDKKYTRIENYAFFGCDIETVDLKDVVFIGVQSFSGCQKLISITLYDSLIEIETSAFTLTGFKTITLPGTLEKIGEYAFNNTSLENVTISEGITTLNDSAFSANKNIKSFTLPQSFEVINEYLLSSCDNFKTLNLGNNIKKIEKYILFFIKNDIDINYSGTMAEWLAIEKDPLWNYTGNGNTNKITIHCSDGCLDKNGEVTTCSTHTN